MSDNPANGPPPNSNSNGPNPSPNPGPSTSSSQEKPRSREVMARMLGMITNAMTMRKEWLNRLLDARRDINDECGYPQSITREDYQNQYDREAIPARVVEVMSKECWQVQPMVFEDEDVEVSTPFEEAWDELGKGLRQEKSYHQDEAGSPVWEYLQRADILSGIGHYGVILLGLNDVKGNDLSQPVRPRAGLRLLFLRCFPESLAEISTFESNPASPRYGMPLAYTITFNDPRNIEIAGLGITTATQTVHWSRVIHIADNLSSSEVFGVPRMQTVFNRLFDIQKVYGAAGEAFWRNAILKLFFETHPTLGGDVEIDYDSLKDQFEQMMNGLQQWMTLSGMSAKSVAPSVVDPNPHIAVHIEAICIRLGIPKRVFMGSERGELASSQDDAAWNDRLKGRRDNYLTPRVIVPFVDRLINLGVLPVPSGYSVRWPDLSSQTDAEKADILVKKTEALVRYISGGGEAVVTPMDFLVRLMEMSEEEAISILENTAEAMEIKEEEMAESGEGTSMEESVGGQVDEVDEEEKGEDTADEEDIPEEE